MGKADVGFYEKEKPGMGRAARGQLLMTNRRLICINYLSKKPFGAKIEDYSDRIEEGLRNEGSFEVSLGKIIEAKSDRILGTGYMRLRYSVDGLRAIILGEVWQPLYPLCYDLLVICCFDAAMIIIGTFAFNRRK